MPQNASTVINGSPTDKPVPGCLQLLSKAGLIALAGVGLGALVERSELFKTNPPEPALLLKKSEDLATKLSRNAQIGNSGEFLKSKDWLGNSEISKLFALQALISSSDKNAWIILTEFDSLSTCKFGLDLIDRALTKAIADPNQHVHLERLTRGLVSHPVVGAQELILTKLSAWQASATANNNFRDLDSLADLLPKPFLKRILDQLFLESKSNEIRSNVKGVGICPQSSTIATFVVENYSKFESVLGKEEAADLLRQAAWELPEQALKVAERIEDLRLGGRVKRATLLGGARTELYRERALYERINLPLWLKCSENSFERNFAYEATICRAITSESATALFRFALGCSDANLIDAVITLYPLEALKTLLSLAQNANRDHLLRRAVCASTPHVSDNREPAISPVELMKQLDSAKINFDMAEALVSMNFALHLRNDTFATLQLLKSVNWGQGKWQGTIRSTINRVFAHDNGIHLPFNAFQNTTLLQDYPDIEKLLRSAALHRPIDAMQNLFVQRSYRTVLADAMFSLGTREGAVWKESYAENANSEQELNSWKSAFEEGKQTYSICSTYLIQFGPLDEQDVSAMAVAPTLRKLANISLNVRDEPALAAISDGEDAHFKILICQGLSLTAEVTSSIDRERAMLKKILEFRKRLAEHKFLSDGRAIALFGSEPSGWNSGLPGLTRPRSRHDLVSQRLYFRWYAAQHDSGPYYDAASPFVPSLDETLGSATLSPLRRAVGQQQMLTYIPKFEDLSSIAYFKNAFLRDVSDPRRAQAAFIELHGSTNGTGFGHRSSILSVVSTFLAKSPTGLDSTFLSIEELALVLKLRSLAPVDDSEKALTIVTNSCLSEDQHYQLTQMLKSVPYDIMLVSQAPWGQLSSGCDVLRFGRSVKDLFYSRRFVIYWHSPTVSERKEEPRSIKISATNNSEGAERPRGVSTAGQTIKA